MKLPKIPKGIFRRMGFPGEPMEHEFDLKPASFLGLDDQGRPLCLDWFAANIAPVTTTPGVAQPLALIGKQDYGLNSVGNAFVAKEGGLWRLTAILSVAEAAWEALVATNAVDVGDLSVGSNIDGVVLKAGDTALLHGDIAGPGNDNIYGVNLGGALSNQQRVDRPFVKILAGAAHGGRVFQAVFDRSEEHTS